MIDQQQTEQPEIQFPTPDEAAAWVERLSKVMQYDWTNLQAVAARLAVDPAVVLQLHLAGLLSGIATELRYINAHTDEKDDCPRCQENREMRALQLKMFRHAAKHIEDEEQGDDWKPEP